VLIVSKKPRQRGGTPLAFPTDYNERMSGSDDIRPAGPGMKLTYDDYLLFPEDGKRHELIDKRRLYERFAVAELLGDRSGARNNQSLSTFR